MSAKITDLHELAALLDATPSNSRYIHLTRKTALELGIPEEEMKDVNVDLDIVQVTLRDLK